MQVPQPAPLLMHHASAQPPPRKAHHDHHVHHHDAIQASAEASKVFFPMTRVESENYTIVWEQIIE